MRLRLIVVKDEMGNVKNTDASHALFMRTVASLRRGRNRYVGINCTYVATDSENSSGIAFIMVDDNGENCISVASGANNALSPDDVDKASSFISRAISILMHWRRH